MKKVLVFILCFFVSILVVDASTGTVICTGGDTSPLNVRSSIGGTSIGGLSCDSTVEILDDNAGSDGNCSKWYNIRQDKLEGYSCGDYIVINNNIPSNIGVSSISDNIYNKDDYKDKVSGDGTISCYEDTSNLSLRSDINGSYTGSLSCGDVITINSVKESSGSCNYYYNVTNSRGESGYVCGYFVNTTKLSNRALDYYSGEESLEDYYNILREKKFPESYLPYLAEIHARHPNWIFNSEIIDLDFDEVVKNESAFGRNLLEGSAFNNNYFSMDINTYDILKNTFYDYDTEEGWYNASSEAIAFYLDPRNYLNEKYIFAFEALQFNEQHDSSTVGKILSGQSFWTDIYNGLDSNVSDDIITATRDIGISSVHIASRIKQEISGIGLNDPRLGGTFTYNDTNYSGYYNFFNIGVYGTNKIVNGMLYAMNNNWNTPFNGLYGGSSFIFNDYVNVNQDTMYYEKFDVSTSNGHYTHQYMQNLAAAVQETNTTYNSYVEIGDYLTKDIVFTIPVYKNMSAYAVISPRVGNPNNYLKDIMIDGEIINGFSYDKYSYDINVPYEKESINISATSIYSGASVSGTGNIKNDKDSYTIEINVVGENNRKRTYTLNINRLDKVKEEEEIIIPEVSTILNGSGIKYNDNYIFGINDNTNISGLIDNITSSSHYASVSIKDSKGNNKGDDIFRTGDVITVSNSKETISYNVLIYGDINGDGSIDKDDCLAILRELNGYTKLENVYKIAADSNKDGTIDKDDCLAILRHLNGYTNLNN